jgi:hypothetical protein
VKHALAGMHMKHNFCNRQKIASTDYAMTHENKTLKEKKKKLTSKNIK